MNVREDYYSSVNLQFDTNDIDRAHHIGLPYTEKKLGKESEINNSQIQIMEIPSRSTKVLR